MIHNCLNCKHYSKEKSECYTFYDALKRTVTITEPQYERICFEPKTVNPHK